MGHARPHAALTSLVLFAGCASGQSAFIEVSGAPGVADPDSVTINVFDGFGRIGTSDIMPARLPGRVSVSGLPSGELRVVAVGRGAVPTLGGVRISAMPGQSFEAQIVLAADTPDRDGDLVPDELDDCPDTSDPLQENAVGSGAGDTCRATSDLLASPPQDLAVADLAGSDLAGTDLAGTAGIDLASNDSSPSPDLGAPASLCASAGVPFCDGFENATLDAHWATPIQSGGTVSVDTTRAYRGRSSLHLHQNALAANGSSDIELNESQSFPASQLYVRAFVYLPTGFASDDAELIFTEQDVDPYQGVLLGVQGTSFHTDNTISGARKNSTTAMARDRWVCLEWTITFGATGATALTVDGTAANGLSGAQNLAPTPAIGQLGLALISQAPAGSGIAARDVWFDEIIVDTKAIGCTK